MTLETVELPAAYEVVLEAKSAGDNSENSDFFIAKTEEAHLLGRVKVIRNTLADAVVVDNVEATSVTPGTVVGLDFGDGDVEHMFFGDIEMSAATDLDVLTAKSPLGRAVAGASEGDAVTYESPTGAVINATVVSIAVPA